MKFVLMTFLFCVVLVNGSMLGQSCHTLASTPGCCSKKASAAALVASQDPSIQVRKDVATGDISYFKKSGCSYSGSSAFVAVSYDDKTQTFVNRAPMVSKEAQFINASSNSTEGKKMDCSQMTKAECLEKMAKGECQPKAKT